MTLERSDKGRGSFTATGYNIPNGNIPGTYGYVAQSMLIHPGSHTYFPTRTWQSPPPKPRYALSCNNVADDSDAALVCVTLGLKPGL